MASVSELACTYAALILHDDDLPITAEKILTIIKAAGITVEPYWPPLFEKLFESRNIGDLIANVGAGGGGGAPIAAAPGAAVGGGGGGDEAAAKEEEKEEEEESEDEFYYGPRHEMHLDIDDLLFLVFQVNLRSSRSQKKPYMVLRRDSDVLPAEFVIDGERYSEIDWRRTLELNLVLQSSYSLTVAICNVDEIPFLMQTEFELSESTTVVSKHVHASTVSAGVNITHKKLNEAAICYPDICFAVEDFEEAFSSLIVSEVQQRFCVILTILKNSEPENSKAYVKSEDAGESKIKTGTKRQDKSRVFGGFVSFSQIKTELIGRQNWLKRISQEQTIRMRGPNGNGFAEVSSSIDPQCYQALSSSNEEEAELGFRQGLDFLKRGVASAKG
eukprot:g230.t2